MGADSNVGLLLHRFTCWTMRGTFSRAARSYPCRLDFNGGKTRRENAMKAIKMKSLAALTLAALGLAACGPDHGDRTAGQKVDGALSRTSAALDTAGRKTQEVVNGAAVAVKDAGVTLERTAGTMGQDASDAAITASIKTDLVKDPELSALKIEVDTKQGVVTLNGVAPNEAAADRAGRIAIAVKGVNEVRNHVVARKA